MPGCSPRKSLPMVVLNGCFRLYGKIKPATVWFHYQYKNQKMLIMLENVRHDLTDYERISPSCLTLCEPMDIAHQSPLSMGFSKQEYWSGLLCPPAGDLPNPGIELVSLMSPSLAGGNFLPLVPPRKPNLKQSFSNFSWH